jgi:hypothetical protein
MGVTVLGHTGQLVEIEAIAAVLGSGSGARPARDFPRHTRRGGPSCNGGTGVGARAKKDLERNWQRVVFCSHSANFLRAAKSLHDLLPKGLSGVAVVSRDAVELGRGRGGLAASGPVWGLSRGEGQGELRRGRIRVAADGGR